jgi:hypothetical protein
LNHGIESQQATGGDSQNTVVHYVARRWHFARWGCLKKLNEISGGIFQSRSETDVQRNGRKIRELQRFCFKGLVPGERIELPTFGLQNRCSTAELTRHPVRDATLLPRF